ncbi:cadmium-transporting ATPase [Halostagnicola larsenii XH-48]|uniref:P-type Cu(+) transporter n=1 Tax=Halostagnicola larsenii XH-48 TaxID=797299 RepID=W0JPR7_9EURY|nr:heavy metal translocating P-type ATPase [Halostagnicola larsenii]AHF98977.1 cadmium-transporting ATPase [Halostagnicola larsenii XH-48]
MTDAASSPDSRSTLELRVPEMDCPSCAGKVTNSIERLEGIEGIESQVTSGRLVVTYDPTLTSEDEIRTRVRTAGYAIAGDESELTVSVPDMDCASCATKVENALERVDAVREIETRPASGRVTVSGGSDLETATVVEAIDDAGYEGEPIEEGADGLGESRAVWRSRRAIGTAIGGALVAVGMVLQFAVPGLDPAVATVFGRTYALSQLLFIGAVAVAGLPVLRNGYYSLRNRSLDIDFLMSAGIVASVAAHHPFEGGMLAVLFSVAELLERYSMDRARDSLRELMSLSPETATVRRDDGSEAVVAADTLDIGDTVIVKPGEKIPADGTVTEGQSAVDQSPITGESVPVDKETGEEVYAGTIVESGYLEIGVESEADDSTIARIVRMVEDAERETTKREQFVDRFASVYTPIVVALAVGIAVVPPLVFDASWNVWFLRGLTLLVIACPCAFVISTPVSVVSGITSAARNGVLIKGGRYLEAVGESDVLAVDKTGTLTSGELEVTDVIPLEGADESDVLARASAIERRSEHPVGDAIVEAAGERGLDGSGADAKPATDAEESDPFAVSNFEALTGRGVRAELDGVTHYVGKPDLFEGLADLEHVHATDGGVVAGSESDEADWDRESNPDCDRAGCLDVLSEIVPKLEADGKTVVVVGTADGPLGVVAVADQVRPEAPWAVSQLQEQGVRVVMLTGDNEGTARAIAEEVGIDEYHAELLPEQKLEWIRRLKAGDRVPVERRSDAQSASDEKFANSAGDRSVTMVGDGINDGPALATATTGVAMGAAGTDTALETADIALMGDDLTRLPYLYRLSRKANEVIKQNIWASLGVKAVLALGAVPGIVTIIHAVVVGDMGMSLGVTGNAMRLAREEPETPAFDADTDGADTAVDSD